MSAFCVDDRAAFRGLLRALIAQTPGFHHAGEAASGEEAIVAVSAIRPDLVLMDVQMPGIGGIAATATLVEGRRDLLVVLMSAGPLEPPPEFAPGGGEVVFLLKEQLCSRRLLEIWHARRTR